MARRLRYRFHMVRAVPKKQWVLDALLRCANAKGVHAHERVPCDAYLTYWRNKQDSTVEPSTPHVVCVHCGSELDIGSAMLYGLHSEAVTCANCFADPDWNAASVVSGSL